MQSIASEINSGRVELLQFALSWNDDKYNKLLRSMNEHFKYGKTSVQSYTLYQLCNYFNSIGYTVLDTHISCVHDGSFEVGTGAGNTLYLVIAVAHGAWPYRYYGTKPEFDYPKAPRLSMWASDSKHSHYFDDTCKYAYDLAKDGDETHVMLHNFHYAQVKYWTIPGTVAKYGAYRDWQDFIAELEFKKYNKSCTTILVRPIQPYELHFSA